MSNQAKAEITLSLQENGVDFILKGIDDLFDDSLYLREYVHPDHLSTRNLKYGVLHLFSGFLLLLKEKINQFQPDLIFNAPPITVLKRRRNTTPPDFGYRTVDFREAIEALKYGPGFEFSKEEMKVIERMQNYRNTLEHYQAQYEKLSLYDDITKFLNIVDKFLTEQLNINLEASIDADDERLRDKIAQIDSAWERIKASKSQEVMAELAALRDSFWADPENEPSDEETEEAESFGCSPDNSRAQGYDTIICDECGEDTLIVSFEYAGICANRQCRGISPITSCDRCGAPAVGFPWNEWINCDDCHGYYQYIMDKD